MSIHKSKESEEYETEKWSTNKLIKKIIVYVLLII